jgi:hypothetical protein
VAAKITSPGVFNYGQVFQMGDLPIYITDLANNPLGPYLVKFTMYYYPKNSQCAVRVGAEDRTPVNVGVGEYYATGVAGQCGQPGDWYIEWKIQEAFDSTLVKECFRFKVFDSAQYCAHGNSTSNPSSCGCSKFRW